jgi:hypothetical protein
MDFFVALLVLLLVATAYGSRRHPRSNGVLDLFGAGFVPYRQDGNWPHGVQEEEPRAWSWQTGSRAMPDPGSDTALDDACGPDGPAALPEVLELATTDLAPHRLDHVRTGRPQR